MPGFLDPFDFQSEGTLSKEDLINAIRLDMANELEAMTVYTAHACACQDPLVKKVLKDIADEERTHLGELEALLRYLDPSNLDHECAGACEVLDQICKMSPTAELSPELVDLIKGIPLPDLHDDDGDGAEDTFDGLTPQQSLTTPIPMQNLMPKMEMEHEDDMAKKKKLLQAAMSKRSKAPKPQSPTGSKPKKPMW